MMRWGWLLLSSLLTIVAAHGLAYALFRYLPDAATVAAGIAGADEAVRQGFARPQTGTYLGLIQGLFRGDLGTSLDGVPVGAELADALYASFQLMAPAALIALLTPVVVGLSWRQGREASSLAEGLAFLPVYLPAAGLLVVSLWLDPGQRGLITRFLACAALALPAACILAAQAARATAEHLGSSFVRTQRACGWHEHRIRLWLLKNLLYRLLPTLEKAWAAMFVALVFVETLFGLSGVGTLAARAIRRSDVPMTLAVVLTAAAGVVALRALATILVPTERRA